MDKRFLVLAIFFCTNCTSLIGQQVPLPSRYSYYTASGRRNIKEYERQKALKSLRECQKVLEGLRVQIKKVEKVHNDLLKKNDEGGS